MEEKLKHLKKSMDRTVFQGDVFNEDHKNKIRVRLKKERQRPWFRLADWFSRSFKPVASVTVCLLLLVVGTFYAVSQGGPVSQSRGGNDSSSADMAESSASDAGTTTDKATLKAKTAENTAQDQAASVEKRKVDTVEDGKTIIHSAVLKKIDREFNTDLPFQQREKYIDKDSELNISWGARYKNGVTISDDGIMTGRVVAKDGKEVDNKLLPFQERPLVRGLIGDVAGQGVLIMKENFIAAGGTRLSLDKISVAKEKAGGLSKQTLQQYHEKLKNVATGKIQRILEAQRYTGKYSPTLETYLDETMNMLGQVKKEGNLKEHYLAYLEGLKRLYLVNLVLSGSEYVKFSVQSGSQTAIQQPGQGKKELTGEIRTQFEKLPGEIQGYMKSQSFLIEHYIEDLGFRERLKLADQMIPDFNGNDVDALVRDTVNYVGPEFQRKDDKILIMSGRRYKKVYERVYRDGINDTEQKVLNALNEIGNAFYLKEDGAVVHPKKLGDIGRAKAWSTGATAKDLKAVSDQIVAHADDKLKVIHAVLPLTEDYPLLNGLLSNAKSYYQSVLDRGAITTELQYSGYYSMARELFIFDDVLNQPVPVKFMKENTLSNRERVERLAQ
ncbi:MAG TPA: hypothetical protein VF149_01220 [Bacillales bacterium]